MDVETPAADLQQAMIYIARDQVEGTRKRGYMEKIVAAAEDFSLPAAYIAELRS